MWPDDCAFTTQEVANILGLPSERLLSDRDAGIFECSYRPEFRIKPLFGVHCARDIIKYDLRYSVNFKDDELCVQDCILDSLFDLHDLNDELYEKSMQFNDVGTLLLLTATVAMYREETFARLLEGLIDPISCVRLVCESWVRLFSVFSGEGVEY